MLTLFVSASLLVLMLLVRGPAPGEGDEERRSGGVEGRKGRILDSVVNQKQQDRRGGGKDALGEEPFKISPPFRFPQPAFSRSASGLLASHWVRDLQLYLKTSRGRTISLVTSTSEHTEVLMNWLIAAYVRLEQPLQDVLVLSLDARLHSELVSRGIPSLFVSKSMVISPEASVPRVFSQVHVVRMAVLRLLNHYGYDVVNYDCDAIPLRNPQPVFDAYSDTDLIGTFGKGPDVLYQKWGVTLNTGVMVMRATPNMGW